METDRQNHNFLSSLLLESEMLRFILFRKFYSGQLLIKILVAVLTNDKLGKDILFDPLNIVNKIDILKLNKLFVLCWKSSFIQNNRNKVQNVLSPRYGPP